MSTDVYALDRADKDLYDTTATSLRAKGSRALAAVERCDDPDALRRLIASCDRDIAAETAAALGLGHEPRSRPVRCVVAFCGRETWAPHAACSLHPIDCDRCLPWDAA